MGYVQKKSISGGLRYLCNTDIEKPHFICPCSSEEEHYLGRGLYSVDEFTGERTKKQEEQQDEAANKAINKETTNDEEADK